MNEKYCPRCDKTLPADAFYVNKDRGRRSWCIDCEKKYAAARARRAGARRRIKVGSKEIHTRVDPDVASGIKYIAKQRQVTQSVVINAALQRYIVEELADATRRAHVR